MMESKSLWGRILILYLLISITYLIMGLFKNYENKKRWEDGQKMPIFVQVHGKTNVHMAENEMNKS